MYILVYVDDFIRIVDDDGLLRKFINKLSAKFSVKDLGRLSYILGVKVLPAKHGIPLSQ